MATVKGFSVAKTQKGFGSAVIPSTVYSLTGQKIKLLISLGERSYALTDAGQCWKVLLSSNSYDRGVYSWWMLLLLTGV